MSFLQYKDPVENSPLPRILNKTISNVQVEDSPIEKMFKQAISNVQESTTHKNGFGGGSNGQQYHHQQQQQYHNNSYQNTALFQQLAKPVVKPSRNLIDIANTIRSTTTTTPPSSESFGHQFNFFATIDPTAWKSILPNGNVNSFGSDSSKSTTNDGGGGKVGKERKKRIPAKPRKIKEYPGKDMKAVKTINEVIEEVNLSKMAGMENYTLGYLCDTVVPADCQQLEFIDNLQPLSPPPSTGSITTTFMDSPDKNSSQNLFPEYSEEIPPNQIQAEEFGDLINLDNLVTPVIPVNQYQEQYGSFIDIGKLATTVNQRQQQSGNLIETGIVTPIQQQTPQKMHRPEVKRRRRTPQQVQKQNEVINDGSLDQCPKSNDHVNSNVVELNRKLLREIAILRLFIRSQKLRIDQLAKQNEAYRKTLQENAFKQELDKIDLMFNGSPKPLSSSSAEHLLAPAGDFEQYSWGQR